MASFTFGFGNFTTAQTLNADEDGFVGIGGNLMVDNDEAVTIAGDDANLTVLGAVYASNQQAVFGGATTGANIFVGIGGSIVAADNEAIEFDAGGQFISNSGFIAALNGSFEAIEVQDGGNTILNTGTVVADGRAIQIDGSGAGEINIITNSGTISGGPGDDFQAIVTNDADDQVSNSGTINGDVLLGAGNDLFDGTGGTVNGTVFGGAGDDTFTVDDPTITLVENADEGFDTVNAETSFELGANFERLNLIGDGDFSGVGNELDNIINGNIGNNVLEGGGGDDVIRGLEGDDTIQGGGGDDRLLGGLGEDTVSGGPGADNILGNADDDSLFGGNGDDRLVGGGGNDVLRGGDGDDRLLGSPGSDALVGGFGRDVLIGGADADRFVFNSALETVVGPDRDRINDFTSAQGDLIDVSGIDANVNTGGDDSFTFIGTSAFTGVAGQLRFDSTLAGNSIVSGDIDGDGNADFQILVVDDAVLTAGDFLL